MCRRASTVVSALCALARAAIRARDARIVVNFMTVPDRFARLNTECRLERRQRGFIADGSHVRPMNFDQGRVPGWKERRKPRYLGWRCFHGLRDTILVFDTHDFRSINVWPQKEKEKKKSWPRRFSFVRFGSFEVVKKERKKKEKKKEKKMYSSIDGEKLTNDEVKLLEVVRREWNESKNWFMRGRNERRQRLDRKWFYAVIWLKIRETGMMDRSNLLERDSIESVN